MKKKKKKKKIQKKIKANTTVLTVLMNILTHKQIKIKTDQTLKVANTQSTKQKNKLMN